ncbi:MAG: ABC transporter permease [Candidatus Aminicenantes bacterium]|nr:ABC transporter permease [Candidatus Aminicenantes bacterium]
MIKNYLVTAVRHLRRHKGHSFINIAGLTMGLACFLLISLWVADELSFDRFHQNKDRIFRVLNKLPDGRMIPSPTYALAPALKAEYPEVEEYSRVWPWSSSLVQYGDKQFEEDRICLADPGFLKMFTFPMVKGNPDNALADKQSIVLTESTARKYFGDEDPLGRVLVLAQFGTNVTVTGVVRDVPANSHIQFDFLARVEFLGEDRLARWEEWTGPCYVLLRPGVSAEEFTAKIAGIYRAHVNPDATFVPVLQPLSRVRLHEAGEASGLQRVVFFSFVAVLILLMACVNFMNLATSRSTLRTKEVGVRKVVGAGRFQLARQFLGEAILSSAAAMVLALVLLEAVLPPFNRFSGKSLALISGAGPATILGLIAVVAATGLLAGSYPAVFLSSFSSVEALVKRGSGAGGRGAAVRKGLIVFQFAISVGLITCTLVASRQMRHIQNMDIGLNRENVVILSNNPVLRPKFEAFKNDLLLSPSILSATSAAQGPTWVGENIMVDWAGNSTGRQLSVDYTCVDFDFFKTFEMPIVRGRAFSREFADDEHTACVINEAAARQLDAEDPLGMTITMNHPAWPESFRPARVIGVVRDFNARSLHQPIRPFVFRMYKPWHQYAFIKIDGARRPDALKAIEAAFHRHVPGYPYRHLFYDEAFNLQYASDRITGALFTGFGLFSVFLSCLGLFGLASHTAERKTREIGIRKVLGATVPGLIYLTTRDFLRWVALSHLIGWPVAYLVMRRWLGQFAFRTNIGPAIFLISAALTLAVSLVAVGYQSIRAALSDPVQSLRYE